MNDIKLCDCGSVGWLGIWEINGKEQYRTGKHHLTALNALIAVQNWIDKPILS